VLSPQKFLISSWDGLLFPSPVSRSEIKPYNFQITEQNVAETLTDVQNGRELIELVKKALLANKARSTKGKTLGKLRHL